MFYSEFTKTKTHQYLYSKLFKVLGSEAAEEVVYSVYATILETEGGSYFDYLSRKNEDFDLLGAFSWKDTRQGFDYWRLVNNLLENN
jgi:hypothetical protein